MTKKRLLPVVFCPVCNSEMTNHGAVSYGDGDLSDEYSCDECGETKLVGTRWSWDGETWFDDQEEMEQDYFLTHEDPDRLLSDQPDQTQPANPKGANDDA